MGNDGTSTQDEGTPRDAEGRPPSFRAQLLATEHWSLLASRSTANAALTAILLGAFLTLPGWPTPGAMLVGSACGLAFAVASSLYGCRQYRDMWKGFPPLSPTPQERD